MQVFLFLAFITSDSTQLGYQNISLRSYTPRIATTTTYIIHLHVPHKSTELFSCKSIIQHPVKLNPISCRWCLTLYARSMLLESVVRTNIIHQMMIMMMSRERHEASSEFAHNLHLVIPSSFNCVLKSHFSEPGGVLFTCRQISIQYT